MSTKLSNGIEYFNPHFPESFGEFLLVNGFHAHAVKDRLEFFKDQTRVVIRFDNIDIYGFHPEDEGQEREKWVFEQGHVGFSHFNLFSWIMLMHITNVVYIGDFLKNSRAQGQQMLKEAQSIVKEIFKSQLVA